MTIHDQPQLDLGLESTKTPTRTKQGNGRASRQPAVSEQTGMLSVLRFDAPDRPLSCLEVDFPIGPINTLAQLELNAKKPIYEMGKWWARRQSSIFRALGIAAATTAPADANEAGRRVWDTYYYNHQRASWFDGLVILDPFMGGGTTLIEGTRLGFDVIGVDLNPIAWFVTKTALGCVEPELVRALFDQVERVVRPQVQPYTVTDCPRGHRGRWVRVEDAAAPFEPATPKRTGFEGLPQPETFDILRVPDAERVFYRYTGPEVVYTFWAKHGPCQHCGHRTPVLSSPVVAVKTLTVRAVPTNCERCKATIDWEMDQARMAPEAVLVVADSEAPYVAPPVGSMTVPCPHCNGAVSRPPKTVKSIRKRVNLTLLVHPRWLSGSPAADASGELGGWAGASYEAEQRWMTVRARGLDFVEVRGDLPSMIQDPHDASRQIETGRGTAWRQPKAGPDGGATIREVPSSFACGNCGRGQDFLSAVRQTGRTAPVYSYALQGYCPTCAAEKRPYNGRFFKPPDAADRERWLASVAAWEAAATGPLKRWVPDEPLPFAYMTHKLNGGIPNWGYTDWWKLFNPRQLLTHARLADAIAGAPDRFDQPTREAALLAFQQYLRNQNMFCFWNLSGDKVEPFMSNNNYHPKATVIENGVFSKLGRGNWQSSTSGVVEGLAWARDPWERGEGTGNAKSDRVEMHDQLRPERVRGLSCASSTDLGMLADRSIDLVITDPPFGNNVFYADLSDFFYAWLRRPLGRWYPELFVAPDTNKIQEAISNPAEHPDKRTRAERKAGVESPADAFYRETLTECWRESVRVLKDGGLLAFTFHHSEDEAWVGVLRSLFDAGLVLVATYPIRSDESKGENASFGSRKIEFDIIHVCRKRLEPPARQSWRKMRDWVKDELERLHGLLQHYQEQALSPADIRVILRGKALEFYSRHYGQVFTGEGEPLDVRQALIGINAILDEETLAPVDRPPKDAEPLTRLYLRFFKDRTEIPRDDLHKQLQGTGATISQLVERGWVVEEGRVVRIEPIQARFEKLRRRSRAEMKSDLDQAHFLIGAAMPGAKVVIREELSRGTFALKPSAAGLVRWIAVREEDTALREAAERAATLVEAHGRSPVRKGGAAIQMPLPDQS